MEDVLDVYARPRDPTVPVVCRDEKPYQLLAHARDPIPAAPGPGPEGGLRIRAPRDLLDLRVGRAAGRAAPSRRPARRTMVDWAHEVDRLLTIDYPDAERCVLVMDNLNTHTTGSLYEAFEPAKATSTRAATGDPPHPQPRVLAQHRRDRTLRAHPPVPSPAHRRHGRPEHRTGRLARRHQRRPATGQLALHHQRRPHPPPPPVPRPLEATVY